MQIEQSMVMKLSHKEVGWDFTDQQEAAVYDMRAWGWRSSSFSGSA